MLRKVFITLKNWFSIYDIVLERDSKLNELDDRATSLQQGAEMFDRNAGKIQRKFWFQNMRMNFIIGGVVLVIIIIIIIVIVTSTKKDDDPTWKTKNI